MKEMLSHPLGRLGIFRTFDLIDFPGSVISPAEADDGEFAMVADLVEGVFSLGDGVEDERLSVSHSERIGTRSLDILHVAAALVLGCGIFHTFDTRQGKLAKAAGLKVRG